MIWQERTKLLIGDDKLAMLKNKHVLVVGLGGVGAYAAENLCRAGIGEMTIVDADSVEITNLNRQLLALHSSLGKSKVELMAERLSDINPDIVLHLVHDFVRDEKTPELLQRADYDYVVDAIDSLSPKVYLIYYAMQLGLKLVSAMGAGGKMDPSLIKVADIKKTYQCRLAHALRKRLHHLGIDSGFKAVFSPEPVPETAIKIDSQPDVNKFSTVGTISYMPAIFGCFVASVVIRDLIENDRPNDDFNY